jgi:hypothetical protein
MCHFFSVDTRKMLFDFTAIVDLGEGLLRVWERLSNLFHVFRMQRNLWELHFDVICPSYIFPVVTSKEQTRRFGQKLTVRQE